MNLGALARILADKGMSSHDIADVMDAMASGVPAYGMEMTTRLAADLKRREYDRQRKAEERAAKKAAEAAAVLGHPRTSTDSADIHGHPGTESPAKDAPAPTYTRGEDNPSRLVDTCLADAVAEDARDPVCDWPPGDANQHAKLLAQLAGTSRLDPSRQPGLATTAGRLAAWKRDGASWTYDVVPAVTIMSQKRGPPIGTWKYFDQAIAQSIADNRRALAIPKANGQRHERVDQPSAKRSSREDNLARAFAASEAVARSRAVG